MSAAGENHFLTGHLKVAASPWKPFIIFYCNGQELGAREKCPEQGNVTYAGAMWELLRLIELSRNVTFSILRPWPANLGTCFGVNNCTGMIGMVNRREVDFAIGMLKYQHDNKGIHLTIYYALRSFHTNSEQISSCRIYHNNWYYVLLHHNCSIEIPRQLAVNHRALVFICLDLFSDKHPSLYCNFNFYELYLWRLN